MQTQLSSLLFGWYAPFLRVGAGIADFPRPLSDYGDSHIPSLFDVLAHRAAVEPLNVLVTAIFFLAILHTFFAPKLLKLSKKYQQAHLERLKERGEDDDDSVSFRAVFLHYLGEIEAVFGIWAVPLALVLIAFKGLATTRAYLEHGVHYNEAVFVVVVMAIASTVPVLRVAEGCLSWVARLGGRTPVAWWCSILICGPLLGSLITEPAAMTISALLLAQQFFLLSVSNRLAIATIGLLFVNVSVGGVLTHFAAPPVIMVANKWEWGSLYVLSHFGWKAALGIGLSTFCYYLVFRKEFEELRSRTQGEMVLQGGESRDVPPAVIAGNLVFLGWTVLVSDSPILVIITALFFMAFVDATRHYQREVQLRSPLLVGFFLSGLVVHGGLQGWWIEPVLSRLGETSLMFGSIVLTAFNDNAAVTYLATLVPSFSPGLKYAVVAGAVTGGGLTLIANAPNPAGNAILSRFFPDGLSPHLLFVGALVPTIINALLFLMLP